MFYFCYLCLFAYGRFQHELTLSVTWWMFYKKQDLPILRVDLDPPQCFGRVIVAHLCCVLFVFVLCLVFPVLPVSLNCPFLANLYF